MSETPSPSAARTVVVAAALELFAQQGFEATSVEQIARAAGVSRSTFFRQFGGKEDVVFADHEVLLADLRTWLELGHENPWVAVCEATQRVFRHFASDPKVARRRYEIVRRVPALRDREIVTVFRYERLFDEYLRSALPGIDPLDAVGFAALVTALDISHEPLSIPVAMAKEMPLRPCLSFFFSTLPRKKSASATSPSNCTFTSTVQPS